MAAAGILRRRAEIERRVEGGGGGGKQNEAAAWPQAKIKSALGAHSEAHRACMYQRETASACMCNNMLAA